MGRHGKRDDKAVALLTRLKPEVHEWVKDNAAREQRSWGAQVSVMLEKLYAETKKGARETKKEYAS